MIRIIQRKSIALVMAMALPMMACASVYEVGTWSELRSAVRSHMAASDTIRLTADIDLNGASDVTLFPFEGSIKLWYASLDGQGHTIRNASLKKNTSLIYNLRYGTIENLNFENISGSGDDSPRCGMLCASCNGSTFRNLTFTRCSLRADAAVCYPAFICSWADCTKNAVKVSNVTLTDCRIDVYGYVGNDFSSAGGLMVAVYGTGYFENCHATGMYISGGTSTGGLIGSISSGRIRNCSFSGTMYGKHISTYSNDMQMGGILGENGSATVTGCTFEGELIADDDKSGGIVGYCYSGGLIENCVNRGYVHHNKLGGNDDILGGIVGETNGTVSKCINYGKVDGGDNCIGGIAGKLVGKGRIENCLNVGSVDGDDRVSGIVGYMVDKSSIDNCISIGAILINGHEKGGGCVGKKDDDATLGRYYWKGNAGYDYNNVQARCSISESNLKESRFVWMVLNDGADAGVWGQQFSTTGTALEDYPTPNGVAVYDHKSGCNGYGYEFLNNNSNNHYGEMVLKDGEYYCNYCNEKVSYEDISSSPYYIRTAEDLVAFANYVNGSTTVNAHSSTPGILCADIDCSEITSWTPIGSISHTYRGTFDGQRHTLKNLTVTGAGNGVGLFGYIGNGATIKDLSVDGSCSFTQTGSSSTGVAAIAGCVYSDPGAECSVTIENCCSEASVSGIANAAGILGGVYNNSSSVVTIKNCYNMGNITGTKESAAICGWANQNFSVVNCWNSGTVSGIESNKTFVRFASAGTHTLTNNYSTGVTQSGVTAVEVEDLQSGRLCYLLNGSTDGSVTGGWYQDLSTSGIDIHPVLYKSSFPIWAHANRYCDETESSFTQYTNDYNAPEVKHDYDTDGYCTRKAGETHYEQPDINNNTYCITKPGHLYWLAENVNNGQVCPNVKLMNDITVNDSLYVDGALNPSAEKLAAMRVWTPIGTAEHSYYNSTFNGDGHVISGLYLPESAGSVYGGLFGVAYNGVVVKDLSVKDSYFYGSQYAGALVGCGVTPTSLTDANGPSLINCCTAGDVDGAGYAGGLAGYLGLTDVGDHLYSCYSLCDVTSSVASKSGPLFGFLTTSTGVSYKNTAKCCYRLDKAVTDGTAYGTGFSSLAFRLGSATELLNSYDTDNGDDAAWRQDISAMDTPVFGDDNVYYQRSISSQWGTAILPYTLTSNDTIQYYSIQSVDSEGKLHIQEAATVAPNTPCIYYSENANTVLLLTDASKNCTAPESSTLTSTISSNLAAVASYEAQTVQPLASGANYYIYKNMMWRGDVAFTLPAFRAYVKTLGDSNNAKTLNLCIDEADMPTKIITLSLSQEEGADNVIYNVSGLRMGNEAKGIMIVNGKKVIK